MEEGRSDVLRVRILHSVTCHYITCADSWKRKLLGRLVGCQCILYLTSSVGVLGGGSLTAISGIPGALR